MPTRGHVSFPLFNRRVVALLVSSFGKRSSKLALKWRAVAFSRWRAGKAPSNVARHIMKYERQKVVCPCKPGGDPSPRCPRHGLYGRDASNPQKGEVYESKNGNRWLVVGRNMKGRVVVKRAPGRFDGELYWTPEMLKALKPVHKQEAKEVHIATAELPASSPPTAAPAQSFLGKLFRPGVDARARENYMRGLGKVQGDPSGRRGKRYYVLVSESFKGRKRSFSVKLSTSKGPKSNRKVLLRKDLSKIAFSRGDAARIARTIASVLKRRGLHVRGR